MYSGLACLIIHPSMTLVKLIMIGHCCDCLGGRLNCLVSTCWLIVYPRFCSSREDPIPKWVINLSSKPLTPGQRSVLGKGPNSAVSLRQPPNLEYITAIEAACNKLRQQDAEEPGADIN